MEGAEREPTINSMAGLVLAFRRWARSAHIEAAPEVRGASEEERQHLAALGGIAAAIAGERVSSWPTQAREWALAGPEPPQWLSEAVALELGRELDVLAVLYNACVSAANRRELGTVFTPDAVVEYMLGLAAQGLSTSPSRIVDPGAGVGAFTIAAARRWPQSDIEAVDLNPVTLGLLATRIAFEIDADPGEEDLLARIQLRFADYLDQPVDASSGPTLTIGNPPYTRVQSLPATSRDKAKSLTEGIIDSGHANLAVIFQAATLAQMGKTDVSCLILPASFTYTRASRQMRSKLWDSKRAIEVHGWAVTERAFIGHSVQAAILLVGPTEAEPKPLQLTAVGLADGQVEELTTRSLSRETPEPPDWLVEPRPEPPSVQASIPLSTIARTRRGVATGANSMFFVSDAIAAELPPAVLTPGILTLRGFADQILDERAHADWGGSETLRWLLLIPPDLPLTGRLAAYVESFRAEVAHRHLPSSRDPWYSIASPLPPALLISPLAKNEFKVVVNRLRAIPSNNLFGIHPANGVSSDALANWLRSASGQDELRRVSNRYPGGSYKLEPSRLSSIRLPRSFAAG